MKEKLWRTSAGYFSVFIVALLLNLLWENFHSLLYAHYNGGEITEFILFRASLADAIIITASIAVLSLFSWTRPRPWLLAASGFIIAIIIEWWALSTGRWAYNELMPIIPLLGTGLTPTIQLAALGYIVKRLSLLGWLN